MLSIDRASTHSHRHTRKKRELFFVEQGKEGQSVVNGEEGANDLNDQRSESLDLMSGVRHCSLPSQ